MHVIGGRVTDPDLDGQIRMTGGRYENLALGLTTTNLDISASFSGAKVSA